MMMNFIYFLFNGKIPTNGVRRGIENLLSLTTTKELQYICRSKGLSVNYKLKID